MITLENYGNALTYEHKLMAADTAVALSEETYKIKIRKISFNSGGTVVPAVGDMLVGATSAAVARIVKVSELVSGAYGDGDAVGTIHVVNVVGTWNGSENANHILCATNEASANVLTTTSAALISEYINVNEYISGMEAKAALLTIETQTARFSLDGLPPTPATHANGWVSRGIPVVAGSSYLIRGINNIRNLKICNAAAGSNTRWTVICFF